MEAKIILTTLALLSFMPALAEKDPVFPTDLRAVRGDDPVAYFIEGQPVKADAGIVHSLNGAKWRFSSEETRAAFSSAPEKYAPPYTD